MDSTFDMRRKPFAIVAVAGIIVSVAVARIAGSLLVQIERSRPFTQEQSGWILLLLAGAAIAQALYGGFVQLRVERVQRDLKDDMALVRAGRERVVQVISRNAALSTGLTIVFGLAVIGLTGERGGYWLFVVVAVAQGAWYYRSVRLVAEWLGFQPRPETAAEGSPGPWRPAGPGYVPPLARPYGAASNAPSRK